MSERDDNRGGSGCAIGWLLMLLVAAVLYVLSTGPVAWLANGNPSLRWVDMIYFPVGLLGEHCEPFRNSLEWYVDMWT